MKISYLYTKNKRFPYISLTFAVLCVFLMEIEVKQLFVPLFLFLLYGIMIEKLLGHLRGGCIFMISGASSLVVLRIIKLVMASGIATYGAGLSGIVYSLSVTSIYILAQTFFMDKKMFWRQPLAYCFLLGFVGELLVLNPVIAGIETFIINLCGLITGVVATKIFRKSISVPLIMKRENYKRR